MEYLVQAVGTLSSSTDDNPISVHHDRYTMDFREYPSIENPRKKTLEFLADEAMKNPTRRWVAMEKIHGANFSFITNGKAVTANKRSGLIAENENFFCWQIIFDRYKEDVLTIFNMLLTEDPTIWSIQIFGEIFGGWYDGKTAKGYKKVQEGVYYTDIVDFLAFDIRVNTSDYKSKFLSQTKIEQIFSTLSSMTSSSSDSRRQRMRNVPVMYFSTFEDMYNLDNMFESTIYQMYGMPKLNNNFAEGFIIKMDTEHRTGIDRQILKNKSPHFLEVTTPRGANSKNSKHVQFASSDDVEAISSELKRYMTKNRLDGIIGKEGPSCHPMKLRNLFINDAVNDFLKDFPDLQEKFKFSETNIRKKISNFVDEQNAK